MSMFVFKILAALAVALILLWIAARRKKSEEKTPQILRSLPPEPVQKIADRISSPAELLAYLHSFFGTQYQGGMQNVRDFTGLMTLLAPFQVPKMEQASLSRTMEAIEPDALLAYAVSCGSRTPAVLVICRTPDGNGWQAGLFQPEI